MTQKVESIRTAELAVTREQTKKTVSKESETPVFDESKTTESNVDVLDISTKKATNPVGVKIKSNIESESGFKKIISKCGGIMPVALAFSILISIALPKNNIISKIIKTSRNIIT